MKKFIFMCLSVFTLIFMSGCIEEKAVNNFDCYNLYPHSYVTYSSNYDELTENVDKYIFDNLPIASSNIDYEDDGERIFVRATITLDNGYYRTSKVMTSIIYYLEEILNNSYIRTIDYTITINYLDGCEHLHTVNGITVTDSGFTASSYITNAYY